MTLYKIKLNLELFSNYFVFVFLLELDKNNISKHLFKLTKVWWYQSFLGSNNKKLL